MPDDQVIVAFFVFAIGGTGLCILLFFVWNNRRIRLGDCQGERVIRNKLADWIALVLVAGSSLFHLGLNSWKADFSTPFGWDVYLMWCGWLGGVGVCMWNHWDDPSWWSSALTGRPRWWV